MSGAERERVWVCCACGKRARDQNGSDPISRGWDESCMLNAAECFVDSLVMDGERVKSIAEGGLTPNQPKQKTWEEGVAEFDAMIASFGNLDTSDIDPELLALAEKAVAAVEHRAQAKAAAEAKGAAS